MRKLLLLAVLVGCGGGNGEPPYVGQWALDAGGGCALGLAFGAAGEYESIDVCPLTDGTLGVARSRGTYAESAMSLVITVAQSTCANAARSLTAQWSIIGSQLRLEDPGGVLLLDRATNSSGTAVATNGCFAADGTFTPSPLEPLP